MERVLKKLAENLSMKLVINFKAPLHKPGKLSEIVEAIINVTVSIC